jgi:hypothetical protein
VRRVCSRGFIPAIVLMAVISIAAKDGAAQQRPALELLDAKGAATTTTITLTGQVKNISPSDISSVTVYCDFQGAGGTVVRTEESKLETDPLKPNSTSEFKCSTKAGPDIKGYNFRFARLFGGPLAVKDSRKK